MTARERALSALFPEGWTVLERCPGQYMLSVGPLSDEAVRLLAALFALDEAESTASV